MGYETYASMTFQASTLMTVGGNVYNIFKQEYELWSIRFRGTRV